ncbi:MAG: M81 family metallopeptidase [Alphaproteobacteria bacterium]|nr:M81 family metallopeptidase [Alphaproteobacteria bacterium]
MRVFTASLATETDTFSPMVTGEDAFRTSFYAGPGAFGDEPRLFAGPLIAARKRGAAGNWQVIEGTCTFAQPAGIVTRRAYELFRDEILDQLRAAMPVDMVVLGLHGAMVADGYDDCEGDLLAHVRAIVGLKVPIGAELDPHCHLTEMMATSADLLICFKESPHTDFLERGEELVDLIADCARGKIKPVMSVYDCRMIQFMPTVDEPMRSFVDKVKRLEGRDGVLSISIVHGYTLGDVADLGTKIVVVTDDDRAKGDRLAEALGRELYALRDQLFPESASMDQALDQALSLLDGPGKGPVVIADRADNAGGGAPSDSTYFIERVIARGIDGVTVGPLWDPIAVKQCFAAGEGGVFRLRFGGKMGPTSGRPIDARVRVLRCRRNATQTFIKARDDLGDAAAIELPDHGGLAVVLITTRTQALGRDLFSGLGVDPERRRIVIVKSFTHFNAAFRPIARATLYTGGPGPLTLDIRQVPYTKLARPLWPLVADPFAG